MGLLSASPVSVYWAARVCNNLEVSSHHRLSCLCNSNNQEPRFSSERRCHRGARTSYWIGTRVRLPARFVFRDRAVLCLSSLPLSGCRDGT